MTLRQYVIAASCCEKAPASGVKSEDLPCSSQTDEARGQASVKASEMFLSLIVSAGLLSSGLSGGADQPLKDTLQVATVTADKGVVVSRTDTLSSVHSFSVSDVLLRNSGLHVGDNGGLSGLKTVSLRGMGSAHTAIYVDGLRVGNVQSGQNDLGMLDAGIFEAAVVDYAQNSVSFKTLRPRFTDSGVAGKVRLDGGSFGTWLPSVRLDFRLSEDISLSANASAVFSEGNYPYGGGQFRANNDVRQMRGGVDLFGVMPEGEWHMKAFYNAARRGTPGSVDWPSEDRQDDRNAFLQFAVNKKFTPVYSLNLASKISYDDIAYTSAWGDSRYGQTEFQLNSSHGFQIRRWWKLSIAADVMWDALASSNYDASRLTAFSALASSFRTDRLSADLAVEYNGAFDSGMPARTAFSPSVGLKWNAFKGMSMTAFGRRAFRIPTFNELYYVGYGNPKLKPENAWLSGVGLDFRRTFGEAWTIVAKTDGFFNYLTDKIISAPSPEDPAIWAPYNVGRVRSAGLDIRAGFVHSGIWHYSVNVSWTFQSAVDMTPDSHTYGTQIPYVARNTVIVDGELSWKGWSLLPVWQLRAGRTDGTGELPDWNSLDITLVKAFSFSGCGLTAKISARNIADMRYEVVSGYPMPGRNMICGIEFKF